MGSENVSLYHWEGMNVVTSNDITIANGSVFTATINAFGKDFSTISDVKVSADSNYVDIKTITTDDALQQFKCDFTFKAQAGTTFPITFTWESKPVLKTNQYYGNTYSHKIVINVTMKGGDNPTKVETVKGVTSDIYSNVNANQKAKLEDVFKQFNNVTDTEKGKELWADTIKSTIEKKCENHRCC